MENKVKTKTLKGQQQNLMSGYKQSSVTHTLNITE